MVNHPNRGAAAAEFREMFPGVSPENGTPEQWLRLMRLAYQNQNDLVDVGKRHTPRSRRWARIGDEANARAGRSCCGMTGIVEIYRRFPSEDDCVAHLEAVRWPGGPVCPYCASVQVSRHREWARDDRWQCQGCKRSFSVTVGTIFHRTHVDLQRWFLLISLMIAAKSRLSSVQAARALETRQATAWSMMRRIRTSMADSGPLLAGILEMDEAYIRGTPKIPP